PLIDPNICAMVSNRPGCALLVVPQGAGLSNFGFPVPVDTFFPLEDVAEYKRLMALGWPDRNKPFDPLPSPPPPTDEEESPLSKEAQAKVDGIARKHRRQQP